MELTGEGGRRKSVSGGVGVNKEGCALIFHDGVSLELIDVSEGERKRSRE